MTAGWWALLGAIVAAVSIGLLWRVREGRVRVTATDQSSVTSEVSTLSRLPEELRRRAEPGAAQPDVKVTLLQLSSTFCAPCRHTRLLLGDLAKRTEGLHHVDVDLTDHPEWSTPIGVHRTPTTLALDAEGRELFRISGVPRRDDLLTALRPYLG